MAKKKKRKELEYRPTKKYKVEPTEALVQLTERLPRGLFAIVCNENARYTAFYGSMASLILPIGSRISFHTGCYVVDSCNRSVLGMNTDEDWICFMGDDHVFPPTLVIKLLSLMYKDDLDVIVPVCFRRSFPPQPVLYQFKDKGVVEKAIETGEKAWYPIDLNDYPEGGLIEVDAAGSAGMIVRQRVFKKMIDEGKVPFFELGVGQWGEDIYFCKKAKDLGFKVHADLDMSLGHILNATTWPVRSDQGGKWAVEYDFNTQGGFALEL